MTKYRLNVSFSSYLYFMPILGCIITIIGAKCWIISNYGNPTPFWDQWDSEAALLYKPWYDGSLNISMLLSPHNEHRILFARLFALLLLLTQGYWDVILQMIANSYLHALSIGVLLLLLAREMRFAAALSISMVSALVISIPFGNENTLAGFQSQFYFLLLFSFVGIYLLALSKALSIYWWLGLLAAISAYFSLASGLLVIIAVIIVSIMQIALRQRCGWLEFAALAVLLILSVLLYRHTPAPPHHAALKPATIYELGNALLTAIGWPLVNDRTADYLYASLLSLIIWTPILLLLVGVIFEKANLQDKRWLALGIGIWILLQMVATAAARGSGILSSRYLDVFVLAIIINFWCLLDAIYRYESMRTITVIGTAVWLILLGSGITQAFQKHVIQQLEVRKATGEIQTKNIKAYLASGNISILQNKPFLHIPYPKAERLAMIIDMPEIRNIMPDALAPPIAVASRHRAGRFRLFIEKAKVAFLRRSIFIMFIGFVLLCISPVAGATCLRQTFTVVAGSMVTTVVISGTISSDGGVTVLAQAEGGI